MKKTTDSISYFNLFFLFLSIIWEPFQIYYLHVDGAALTILAIGTAAVVFNIGNFRNTKDILGSPAFICWTILVIYSFLNSMIQGFVADHGTLLYIRKNFLDVYVFFFVILVELKRNKEICLKVVLLAQLTFLVIGITHLSVSLFERISVEELGNMLPLMATSSVFTAGVLFTNRQLKGAWFTISLVVLFALYIIIITATRKAFGAIVILLIGIVLSRDKISNLRTLLLLLASFVALYYGMQFVLNNTALGTRLTESSELYDVHLSSNSVINSFLMTLLGDRANQYLVGVELFRLHPIFGIGLNNYMSYSQAICRLHTEYMVQLCENGIIGFSLLMAFYIILFRGLVKVWKRQTGGMHVMIYFSGLLMVLFLNLTAWTYNMNIVMIVYAVLITQIYSNNANI